MVLNIKSNNMTLQELKEQVAEMAKKIEALEAQEKETIEYPIYCLQSETGLIVKFTGLQEGYVVKKSVDDFNFDEYYEHWIPHKETENWTQLEVCPDTGFFDGQLVWCWDKHHTHSRVLRFYDVKNSITFSLEGKRDGVHYDNHEAYEGNYPEWAQEAFKTLER